MRHSIMFAMAGIAAIIISSALEAAAPAAPAQSFASCAVNKYDGAELLATTPGSEEESGVLQELSDRGCSAAATPAALLRGALAEELFKKDFGVVGARPRSETIEIFRVDASELEALDANSRRRIDAIGFATCAAAANVVKTSAMLKTVPGSVEEGAFVKEMEPSFSPCLLQGERLHLGKDELRGVLAEGIYRLALAYTVDEEVVVTGTRDPARRIVCRSQENTGTHLRRGVCLTEAQWQVRDRDNEYLAEDFAWRAMRDEERSTAIMMQLQRAAMSGGN